MLKLLSPAKVNLFLAVQGRRQDGFHELLTVFQTLDFGDYISFRPHCELALKVPESIPGGSGNLAWRAAALFYEAATLPPAVEITIEKHIPVAAGLGGGSSNAATVLRGLNSLNGNPLDEVSLLYLARRLGSDVPFFLRGGTALGRGRGDRITQLPDLPSFYVRLLRPPFGLGTGDVFSRWQGPSTADWMKASRSLGGFNLPELLHNDLEEPAFAMRPRLRALRDLITREGAVAALLSGSGSVLYGVYHDKPTLPPPPPGCEQWLARTLPAYDLHI